MWPVTDAFLTTVRGSHRVLVDAVVTEVFQTGPNPAGVAVPIVSGSVTFDASADVRATGTLTTAPDTGADQGSVGWPTDPGGLLAPYGNEVFLRRGVDHGGGRREMVPLGYFQIRRTRQDDVPLGAVSVQLADRMMALKEARLLRPVQFPAGTSVADIFTTMVGEVYPTAVVQFDFNAAGDLLARSQIVEKDRHGFLADIARARGRIMHFNGAGALVVESPPDPNVPVFTVDAGPGGVLVSSARELTREQVYNAVVATGEGADTQNPVRGVARDMNPASPTFWGGKFGKVPRYYSSSFLTSKGQAETAARAILLRALGLPHEVTLGAVPNPALEPYDPIRVKPARGESPRTHVIDTLTIPLTTHGVMSGTTRQHVTTMIDTE